MSAWFDNYDLDVCTPNGLREIHAMVVEFTQHALPAGNGDDPYKNYSTVTIPPLTKTEVKCMKLSDVSPVTFLYYTGPPKSMPLQYDYTKAYPSVT